MAIYIKNEGGVLTVKTKEAVNSSLSNKEVLKNVLKNIDENTKQIIISSEYLNKEYDAELFNDLSDYETTDPISDYLSGNKKLENTKIIKKAKKYMKKGANPAEIYNSIFNPKITPTFIKSKIKLRKPKEFKKVTDYIVDNTKIMILRNENQFRYHVNPVESTMNYDKIKAVTQLLQEIGTMELSLKDFKEEVINLIDKRKISADVKNVVKRYSIGFGILEAIFNDENIQDVYFYSSGSNLHVTHAIYGDCDTNITLTKHDVEAIATKIRVASGRPFDDSFPVIDYELKDYNIRVCGVREPLTFDGIGYAFRKHRKVPWSLSSFIENSMISSEVAGLLNFLVDGQCSILITGPRGSGKTSLLSALVNEVPINQRIIIIEDTPELPVDKLSDAGFRIQHLRVKPPLKSRSTDYELSAEEALRTALRLGESVLVIGEVRGEEAKALFEAMRVGATGNVVLGTIHGSSVYDTFDRIVNDLKVPPTSFKSTDIIISCANLRRGESLFTDRRVISVTEVQKNWTTQPVFKELTVFDRKTKTLKLNPKIRNSVILRKIANLKGISMRQCLNSIKKRGTAKELLVKLSIPKKPRNIARFNIKLAELLAKKQKNWLTELRKYLDSEHKGRNRTV